MHATGAYEDAAVELDLAEAEGLYGDRNALLLDLERGAVAFALDDPSVAIERLETAERRIELKNEISPAETVGQWLLNDTVVDFIAEPYEDIYINVFKLLARLERGELDGGASVEARRTLRKADQLRDRYLQYQEALFAEGGGRLQGELLDAPPDLQVVNEAGDFIESPLGAYLSAVTFLKLRDANNYEVASRRFRSSVALQRDLMPGVDPTAFADLGVMGSDEADLLVVAFAGRGPLKEARQIGPILLGTFPVYFQLPRLVTPGTSITSAMIEVEGVREGFSAVPMRLAEDLGAVATENHRRQLPLIYTRTITRALAKTATVGIATEAVGQNTDDDAGGTLLQLAALGIGFAFIVATEKADLRCWSFLPAQARVAVVDLPPGEHRVRVVYRGGTPETRATPWQTVTIRDGDLATVVTHDWR